MTDKKDKANTKKKVVGVSSNNFHENIYQKIARAIDIAKAVRLESAGRYNSFTWNGVSATVKKACTEARILCVPETKWQKHDNGIECLVTLRVVDIDNYYKAENGEAVFHSVILANGHAYSQFKGNDDTAKASGSVYSYAYKYAQQKGFMLEVEDGQEVDSKSSNQNFQVAQDLEEALGTK